MHTCRWEQGQEAAETVHFELKMCIRGRGQGAGGRGQEADENVHFELKLCILS